MDENKDTEDTKASSPDPSGSPPPTASGSSGGPPSSAGGSSDKKRRRRRRAKKGGRKRNASGGSGNGSSAPFAVPLPSTSRPSSASQRFQHRLDQQQQQRRAGGASGNGGGPARKQVYLRPTNGPLLNAPRNSTQFIIDDHEPGDDEFMNFDRRRTSRGAQNNDEDAQEPTSSSKTPSADDAEDGSTWDEDYSERDFQTVYESAHREEIAAWDRKRLCDEIASLERRQKELVNVLARVDPEMYLEKLQTELLALQETNRSLRRQRATIAPGAVPDSSTKEVASGQVQGEGDA